MRFLTVTFKDMLQSTRSFAGLMFMFAIPLLVTGLFFLMFGGVGDEGENNFDLPQTTVLIVNNDSGTLPDGMKLNVDSSVIGDIEAISQPNMGSLLEDLLKQQAFSEIMLVSSVDNSAEARLAVDIQETQLAIIIPVNFTDALLGEEQSATVELYKDPTLTFGPAIVESILRQLLDGFSANQIGLSTIFEQFSALGILINPELIDSVSKQFIEQSASQGSAGSGDSSSFIHVITASGGEESST